MDKKRYYFYIEPYVHISIKKNNILLYNTTTGQSLEYKDNPKITRIIRRLKSRRNLLVINLTERDLSHPEVAGLVKKARDYYMGDLMHASFSKGKPVQLMPMLNVPSASKGENMMNNLNEVSLYINGGCEQTCSLCNDAWKQFLFCRKNHKSKNRHEIDIHEIERLLEVIKWASLIRLNIVGGNIFEYSKFKDLVSLLNRVSIPKTYYVHYLNLEGQADNLASFDHHKSKLRVLVHFPSRAKKLRDAVQLTKKTCIDSTFVFVIGQKEEAAAAQDIISQLEIASHLFKPYYNGQNINFFEEAVFVTREALLKSKPSQEEILSNGAVNGINFGKLAVLNNGDIHANVNAPMLGKLGKDSFYDVVYKEMAEGKSWRRLKKNVTPCKGCQFAGLCPPLSNYEYAIGRNNLCHI